MKKFPFTLVIIMAACLCSNAQDTLPKMQDTSKKNVDARKFQHEVGINSTLLLKQILSFSNNNLVLSPYNLSYRLICSNWALRGGFGIEVSNSGVTKTTYTYVSNGTNPQPGPNPDQPNESRLRNLFYRVGVEYRYKASRKVVAYAGADLIGQNSYSFFKNSQEYNNLPSSYQFTTTTESITTNGFGGGIVTGIQFYLGKRISLFTEMPVYFLYSSQVDKTANHRQTLQNSYSYPYTSYYTYYDNNQTMKTKSSSVTLTLPVTIYLSVKF